MKIHSRIRPGIRTLWLQWIKPMALVSAVMFPFKSAVADLNWVPTGSMKPTILEGDFVFVNKLAYDMKIPLTLERLATWQHPKKGDIVVFFSPADGLRLVKRMVAGPGDAVELRENRLFINDRAMDYEPCDAHPFMDEIYEDTLPQVALERGATGRHWVMALPSRPARRSFPRQVVPEGKYFMMGDSRDNSMDSRFFGCVDRRLIVGRVEGIVASLDKNHLYTPRFHRTFSGFGD
jgi:signal peptidase I